MKKLLYISLLLTTTSLSSCHKDHTCKCKKPNNEFLLEDMSKEDAERKCNEADNDWASSGGSCELE